MVAASVTPIYERLITAIVNEVNTKNKKDTDNKSYIFNIGNQMSVIKLTGPLKYTQVILDYVKKYGTNGITITCPDGNGIFIYDFSGNHQGGASYNEPGKIIK